MPVSHSHQLLCVPRRPLTMTLMRVGFDGSVTSHISCAEFAVLPYALSRYVFVLSPRGSVAPLQTRTCCAPPDSAVPPDSRGCPGMWARYLGFFGSVTSTIEVPCGSSRPVIGFIALPP